MRGSCVGPTSFFAHTGASTFFGAKHSKPGLWLESNEIMQSLLHQTNGLALSLDSRPTSRCDVQFVGIRHQPNEHASATLDMLLFSESLKLSGDACDPAFG